MSLASEVHDIYKPYFKLVEPLVQERDEYNLDAENKLSAQQLAKWKALRKHDDALVESVTVDGKWKKPDVGDAALAALYGAFNRPDAAVAQSIFQNKANWNNTVPLAAPPKPVQFLIPSASGSTDYQTIQKEKAEKEQADKKAAEEMEKASRTGRKTIFQLDLSKYGLAGAPKVPVAMLYAAGLAAALKVAKAYDWKRDQDKTLADMLCTKGWDSVPVDDARAQALAQVLGTTTAKVKAVWAAQAKLWDAVEAGKKGAKPPSVPSPAMAKLAVYPSVTKAGTPIKRQPLPPAPVAEGADDTAQASGLMDMLPWIAGGVALAGLALFLYNQHKKSQRSQHSQQSEPLALANPARAHQLEQRAARSHGLAGRQTARHNSARCLTCN